MIKRIFFECDEQPGNCLEMSNASDLSTLTVSYHNRDLNTIANEYDMNLCIDFSDLVAVSDLQHLHSESNLDHDINNAVDFNVKNPFFYPIQSRCPALDNFQSLVHKELVDLHQKQSLFNINGPSNLNPQQQKALKQLTMMQDVVIRQADKGGRVVVLDKGLYLQENKHMLADKKKHIFP